MTIRKFYIFLLLLINSLFLSAQDISRIQYELIVGSDTFVNPFTGGLNSPQFSKMDINLDGIKDLIVFDRLGDKLMVFLADDKSHNYFKFSSDYDHIFPDSLNSWVILKDYNNDGIEDIFTSYGDAIQVYKTEIKDNQFVFEKYNNPYSYKDVLTTKGQDYDVFCYDIDIPAITDVDFDGDIDILSFAQGNRLYFYKNICVESDVPLDSFRMIFADQCWGKFVEDYYSEDIILSDSPYKCADNSDVAPRHSGSTTLALDIDEDGDYDLIVGDVDYESAIYLHNGGSKKRAFITSFESRFPQYSAPISLKSFIGAFNVDIDRDGKKDLIIAPNEDKSSTALVQNIQNIHYYKNNGADSDTQFQIVKKDFLVDDMLDLGGNTYPTFVDIDVDGLVDIVIGTGPAVRFDSILPSKLYYFKNIGTKKIPKFELVDDDYLKFSSISVDNNLHYFAPTFGDLDGDGDLDLLVGNNEGTLIFCQNNAGVDLPLKFDNHVLDYMGIDVLYNSCPAISDINLDGLSDILLGLGYDYPGQTEYFGSLVYFQNIGTKNNPQFDQNPSQYPNTNFFGKLILSNGTFNKPRATISIFKDKDDELLFAGKWDGKLNVYRDFHKHIYDVLPTEYDNYGAIDVGNESAPAVADIDSDGYLEMLIGTDRGGLEFWNTNIKVNEGVPNQEIAFEKNIKIYPNPFQSYVNIKIEGLCEKKKSIKYKLIDIEGKTIDLGFLDGANTKLDINQLNSGVYFISLYCEGKVFTGKIVKTNID